LSIKDKALNLPSKVLSKFVYAK